MVFGSASPPYTTGFNNQKALTTLTDEEFRTIRVDPTFKGYQIAFQIVSFLLFLGPLRVLLGIFIFFMCGSFVNVLQWITIHIFNSHGIKYTREICKKVVRFGFVCFNTAMGIVYYQVKGKIDPETRFFVANHTALIDPFIFFVFSYYTPVIKAEVQKVKFLNLILDCVDAVYVDRSQHKGQAQTIVERANNSECEPVLIFPEGTTAGGDFMLKFHRTPFLTDYKVQPVAMRYCMPLVPADWNYYSWKKATLLHHLWMMISMPPSYIRFDILPAMTKNVEGEGDPEKFSVKCELALANHLGIRATDRSSSEIYLEKKKTLLDQKETLKQKTE